MKTPNLTRIPDRQNAIKEHAMPAEKSETVRIPVAAERPAPPPHEPPGSDLSDVRDRLARNLVGEVVVILLGAVGALYLLGATYAMATQDHFTGATLYFGYLADGLPATYLLATAVITAVVAIRTWRMLAAANSRDVVALRRLSSPGWAVIAIFFSLVGPGVALPRANRTINELQG